MYFNNASPYAGLENQDKLTSFLLRVLKIRLEEYLGFELENAMFCEIMEVACHSYGNTSFSNNSEPGSRQLFVDLFKNRGFEENYAERMVALRSFFFDSISIAPGALFDEICKRRKNSRERYPSIVLHIPHAGTEFFSEDLKYKDVFLRNAKSVIDWHTDKLFSPEIENSKVIPVVVPFCRTVCDVERMIGDPMEERNLGICYDSHSQIPQNGFFKVDGETIERRSIKDLSFQYYLLHHHKMEDILLKNEGALLIDCHSFSSHKTVINSKDLNAGQIAEVDVCIGYNEDSSKPQKFAIQTIINHFASFGYRVAVNTPFSNSKTFNSVVEYESVMIELNKKLYMNEDTLEPNDNFDKLHQQILALYGKLLS